MGSRFRKMKLIRLTAMKGQHIFLHVSDNKKVETEQMKQLEQRPKQRKTGMTLFNRILEDKK